MLQKIPITLLTNSHLEWFFFTCYLCPFVNQNIGLPLWLPAVIIQTILFYVLISSSFSFSSNHFKCGKSAQYKWFNSKSKFQIIKGNLDIVYTLTKNSAQEQGLDQVEVCVWGVREGVADRRVMIQLKW